MSVIRKIAQAGTLPLEIDANSLNPGIYFYTAIAGSEEVTKKMIID